MMAFNLLSLLCFALLASALPTSSQARKITSIAQTNSAFSIYDFLISDIKTSSFYDRSGLWNTSLAFTFLDPNSNTSTTCEDSWVKGNGTDKTPYGPSYIRCSATPDPNEFFSWHINTFSSPRSFSMETAHYFSDPVHYPPPYSYVQYFSRSVNISLSCTDPMGSSCSLPASETPVHALIDSISN